MAKPKRPSSSTTRQGSVVIKLERQHQRPRPPESLMPAGGLLGDYQFVPAPDLAAWMKAMFIAEDGPLRNPDHAHLQDANLGVLWTNAPNARHQREIVGQAELMPPMGSMGKWQRARAEAQIIGWFGQMPDFLLTFYALYADQCSDAAFCALVEHELYHCGQERDQYGLPKFSKSTGRPVYGMRGHDVEEFTGVVRRYGAQAAGVTDLVAAAAQHPEVAKAQIDWACGTCMARAA